MLGDVIAIVSALLAVELGDVIARVVERRHDDVRGHVASRLQDVLGAIGLDDLDTRFLEHVVETDLLGHHALGLDGLEGAVILENVERLPKRLVARRCKVHIHAMVTRVLRELLHVVVEVLGDVIAYVHCRRAQTLPIRLRLDERGALLVESLLRRLDCLMLEVILDALGSALAQRRFGVI